MKDRILLTAAFIAIALLFGSLAFAQSDWADLCSEGETCTLSTSKAVRYGEPWTPRWSAERIMPAGSLVCGNAAFGDPAPGVGKRCQSREAPTLSTGIDWRLTWAHATTNEDGSPLTDRSGYRVETSLGGGPFVPVATTSAAATAASLSLPAGSRCFRVVTLSPSGDSLPSAEACRTQSAGAVPQPPGNVGGFNSRLDLVSGTASGLRAVYARTSTGSRGALIGQLSVGPTTQTEPPFDRVRCDRADSFLVGTTRYARVVDLRAPTAYRAGYVSGCVSYGNQ